MEARIEKLQEIFNKDIQDTNNTIQDTNNTITEIRNILEGINSKIIEAE